MKLFSSSDPFAESKQLFEKLESNSELAKATFGGGCFWCLEAPFEQEAGVKGVIAGYMGGQIENPTYQQVSYEKTGHREVVQIYYHPKVVTYQRLLEIFWLQIDPTDPDGQFADRGHHYTTAILFYTDEQKDLAEKSKSELAKSGKYDQPIATTIEAATSFFPAEDYHQSYSQKNPGQYKSYVTGSGRKAFVEKNKQLAQLAAE